MFAKRTTKNQKSKKAHEAHFTYTYAKGHGARVSGSREAKKQGSGFDAAARRIAMGSVIFSAVAVVAAVFCGLNFTNTKTAERTMEKMAKEYYESYYYDELLAANEGKTPEEALSAYAENGLPSVYLRHLLLYGNQRNADQQSVFNNAHFACDTSSSTVKFYPAEPYGRTNYTMAIKLSCEDL